MVYPVIRTQVLLDAATHAALRKAAAARGKGMSALVREILSEALRGPAGKPGGKLYDWDFIGMGNSGVGDIAENHDRYLNEGKRW